MPGQNAQTLRLLFRRCAVCSQPSRDFSRVGRGGVPWPLVGREPDEDGDAVAGSKKAAVSAAPALQPARQIGGETFVTAHTLDLMEHLGRATYTRASSPATEREGGARGTRQRPPLARRGLF